MPVASYGYRKQTIRMKWIAAATNDQLLSWGEPFLVDGNPEVDRVALIKLFGPGHFWAAPEGIIGEGLDPDPEEYGEILDLRRSGVIWGKWFGPYCRHGEMGTRFFAELEVVSEATYQHRLYLLQRGSP